MITLANKIIIPHWLFNFIIYEEVDDYDEDDLPFEVSDDESYEDICNRLEKYIEDEGIGILRKRLADCDAEEGWESTEFVIKWRDKYYMFTGVWNSWEGWENRTPEAYEVKPVEKTIIDYEIA